MSVTAGFVTQVLLGDVRFWPLALYLAAALLSPNSIAFVEGGVILLLIGFVGALFSLGLWNSSRSPFGEVSLGLHLITIASSYLAMWVSFVAYKLSFVENDE